MFCQILCIFLLKNIKMKVSLQSETNRSGDKWQHKEFVVCRVPCRVRFYIYVYAYIYVSCLPNMAITSATETPKKFLLPRHAKSLFSPVLFHYHKMKMFCLWVSPQHDSQGCPGCFFCREVFFFGGGAKYFSYLVSQFAFDNRTPCRL